MGGADRGWWSHCGLFSLFCPILFVKDYRYSLSSWFGKRLVIVCWNQYYTNMSFKDWHLCHKIERCRVSHITQHAQSVLVYTVGPCTLTTIWSEAINHVYVCTRRSKRQLWVGLELTWENWNCLGWGDSPFNWSTVHLNNISAYVWIKTSCMFSVLKVTPMH